MLVLYIMMTCGRLFKKLNTCISKRQVPIQPQTSQNTLMPSSPGMSSGLLGNWEGPDTSLATFLIFFPTNISILSFIQQTFTKFLPCAADVSV